MSFYFHTLGNNKNTNKVTGLNFEYLSNLVLCCSVETRTYLVIIADKLFGTKNTNMRESFNNCK